MGKERPGACSATPRSGSPKSSRDSWAWDIPVPRLKTFPAVSLWHLQKHPESLHLLWFTGGTPHKLPGNKLAFQLAVKSSAMQEEMVFLVETHCSKPLCGVNTLHASRINTNNLSWYPVLSCCLSLSCSPVWGSLAAAFCDLCERGGYFWGDRDPADGWEPRTAPELTLLALPGCCSLTICSKHWLSLEAVLKAGLSWSCQWMKSLSTEGESPEAQGEV